MGNITVESDATALDLLLEKVYRDSRYDFRSYRRGTVTRRLGRRVHAVGAKTYLEYMQFLDVHPEEYDRLADDLAIKVSGFFRSPYTFLQVSNIVLPELVSYKRDCGQRNLRFWSTACARGEEPYSIAMLLADFPEHRLGDFNISIYATDISRQALNAAQTGRYAPRTIESLSPPILENYFIRQGEDYVINPNLRQMVNISYFDLVSNDPSPFVNLDCIFCCNVLIYLQKQLQARVLDMLYNSLATPGYLILGEVETPTDNLRGRLECLDTKAKIYKKSGGGNHA